MTTTPLPNDIRSLSVADRVRLAEQIWDSVIEDEAEFSLSEAQEDVLRHRIATHRANPERGRSWEQVKADLLGD